jgi:hypothetical protein
MAPLAIKRTTETAEHKEMPTESSPADSHRLVRVAEKMHNKEYRDGYVAAHTRQVLAKQMREFRGDKSQTEFAEMLEKRQTVVSRLENPSYSGWTLSTLFDIASKLSVAVFIRFVDFPTFLKYSGDQSEAALHPAEYNQQQVDDFALAEANREIIDENTCYFNLDQNIFIGSPYAIPAQNIPASLIGGSGGFVAQPMFNNAISLLGLNTPANAQFVEVDKLKRELADRIRENAQLHETNARQAEEIKFLRNTLKSRISEYQSNQYIGPVPFELNIQPRVLP